MGFGAHVLLLPALDGGLEGGGGAHVLLPTVPDDGLDGGGGGRGSSSELFADFEFSNFLGSSAGLVLPVLGLRGLSSELHVLGELVKLVEAAAVPPPGHLTGGVGLLLLALKCNFSLFWGQLVKESLCRLDCGRGYVKVKGLAGQYWSVAGVVIRGAVSEDPGHLIIGRWRIFSFYCRGICPPTPVPSHSASFCGPPSGICW